MKMINTGFHILQSQNITPTVIKEYFCSAVSITSKELHLKHKPCYDHTKYEIVIRGGGKCGIQRS